MESAFLSRGPSPFSLTPRCPELCPPWLIPSYMALGRDLASLRCSFLISKLCRDMATHSRILAWKIPWTEEPGGLQPMGSQRLRHDWASNTTQQYAYLIKKKHAGDFPGDPEVKIIYFLLGAQVWSLVWELRSHMPHGTAKKKNACKPSSAVPGAHKCCRDSKFISCPFYAFLVNSDLYTPKPSQSQVGGSHQQPPHLCAHIHA